MDEEFPRAIRSHGSKEVGEVTGSTRYCQMEGCRGKQYFVRWPDGKKSWPCSKGIVTDPDGVWRIG